MDERPCPICGYDPSGLTPADTVVAVRSMPRRFRELLEAAEAEEPGRATLAGADGWAPAGHAAAAAAEMEQVAGAFGRVAVGTDPVIELPAIGAEAPTATTLPAALESVDRASRRLATGLESVKGRDWERSGRALDGQTWSALELARLGVHAGVHHLRKVEQALADLRE